MRRVLGREHPSTLMTAGNLAFTLHQEGHYGEAEKLERETIEADRRVYGPESDVTLFYMGNMADTLESEGKYDEAESILRQRIDALRRLRGPDNSQAAWSLYALGTVMALRGRKGEALSFLREAVDHGLPVAGDLAMETDEPLKSLHGDPRFAAMVAYAKQRASAAQAPKK